MKKGLIFVWLVILIAALAGCNNGGSAEPTEAETAALAYAEAVLANDDLYLTENTCDNVPSGSASLDMYSLFTIGMAVRESLTHSVTDLDIDLEASTESETANEALIHMTGDMTFPDDLPASELAPLPIDHTVKLDEVWRIQLENGVWKWCGGTLNEN